MNIKNKIEKIGVPLKDWDIQINYGIKTGCNEAFIINNEKREEILLNCLIEGERKITAEIIRPLGSALGSGYAVNREGLRWTRDLKKEVQEGLVKCAPTVEELASQIGVPAEELAATVQKWNADMAAGKDTLFGRPLKAKGKGTYIYDAPELSAPLSKPPFLCNRDVPDPC